MKQEWEAYWDNYRFPDHFMRSDGEPFNNPVRVLVANMALANGKSVLDVGSASCISYPLFKDKMDYVGMDFTLNFLKAGRARDRTLPVVCGYALVLPFKDEAFDTVFIKDVFEHTGVDAFKTIIKEMWRVARVQIILVFYGRLKEKTIYDQTREPDEANIGVPPYKGGLYYFNHYGKKDIEDAIITLDGCSSYQITEGVPLENNGAPSRTVIVVRKEWLHW